MILLVYYPRVIRATWNCQLSHKRGITFSILNDSIDKCRFCLLTIHHVISGLTTGETAGEKETNKPANTHRHLMWAEPLARQQSEGRGWVGREESPAAVGRSHTQSVQQQTQFTKRHLFHYSDALWLITSWPICEMTATYSPVNHKICTCSMWAVGSKSSAGG